jgi:anti-sigma B factor antagonist
MPSSGLVVTQVRGVAMVSFSTASIIDMPIIESVAGELYALVDQQAHKRIVLDFAAVRFLSSQMVGVLLSLQKKAKQIGGRVVLSAMRPGLKQVFQIAKLDKVLEFADDEREALTKLDVLG